ncbi:hypothetical protein GWO43_08595 [candidate division KSB1 bacterium]|nr:hypothetical protein [candidate division KSB1 bacterium]NIR68774.1 hypothetical protein [candidate division KSB1 bacterium]NIS24012.1 hypothetical protein [candidate division KSB1 bacterium]NIT70939.1 hypothetical protein [candidate division KSB1 bacterium]NIU24660.1 hypothetical protein [candidate division KSB1 bacterium]
MFGSIKLIIAWILVFMFAFTTVNCSKKVEDQQGEATMSSKSIQDVLKEHGRTLMDIPGVEGVGQGLTDDDQDCVRVFVSSMTPEVKKQVPKTLDGYPVIIEVTGEFKALDDDQD